MRLIKIFILSLFLIVNSLYAQTNRIFSRSIFSKEISFITTDTVHGAQSTVIEYPKYLVVIELPMIGEGGGRSVNLVQDTLGAERFLNYLNNEYNNKPVKYVLSSHWHLHSLSGITPFFNRGTTLVAAKSNWEYSVKNGLFGNQNTKALEKQVVLITKDTTILNNTHSPIQVLFLDETYTNKPTKDYLFFYMKKDKAIHASCMCAMAEIDFKQRPEFIYSDRVTDLDRAIKSRRLEIEHLFKLTAEFDKEKKVYKSPVLTNRYFLEFKAKGKPTASVVSDFANYQLADLKINKDSILQLLAFKKVSPYLVNSTVYSCIKKKEYRKAIEWAMILNLYHLGKTEFIDTLGEAYYNAGETALAKQISNQLAMLDSKMTNQMIIWEQNSANVR